MPTYHLQLHGLAYELRISSDDGTLHLDLEEDHSGQLWAGEFSTRYVEEITRKTGSFKKFSVFVQMLEAALRDESESVFVDVLTYADLQALKSRKAGTDGAHAAAPAPTKDKRYVILTYASQYDRVHYPLPLSPDDPAEPQHLRRVVARLQRENAELRSRVEEFATGGEALSAPGIDMLRRQVADAQREKEEARAAYTQLQHDSNTEIAKVRHECDALAQELHDQSERVEGLRAELVARAGEGRALERLRAKLSRLEHEGADDRDALQRSLAKHKKEIALLSSEAQRAKKEEERLRRTARQLEAELKIAQRRAAAARAAASPSDRWCPPRATNRPRSSRQSSRAPSATSSAGPPSRASSAGRSCSSVGASQRGSRPSSSAPSRPASAPGSRATSRGSSRAGSDYGGSRPGSRASSAERGRPSPREAAARLEALAKPTVASDRRAVDAARADGRRRPGWRPASREAPPSIEHAAREALLQTARAAGERSSRKLPSGRARGGRPAGESHAAPSRAPAPHPRCRDRQRSDGLAHASVDAGSAHERYGGGSKAVLAVDNPEATKENFDERWGSGGVPPVSATSAVDEGCGGAAPDNAAPEAYDATADIEDIDRRLNALQEFLQAVKTAR